MFILFMESAFIFRYDKEINLRGGTRMSTGGFILSIGSNFLLKVYLVQECFSLM